MNVVKMQRVFTNMCTDYADNSSILNVSTCRLIYSHKYMYTDMNKVTRGMYMYISAHVHVHGHTKVTLVTDTQSQVHTHI